MQNRLGVFLPAMILLLNPFAVRAADMPASLAAAVHPFVERHSIAGAVMLVADNESVLSVETVGHADIAAGRKMEPNALFWIASQSKGMTAAAVMMLVDEGRIALDDPVEKYLPEFKSQLVVFEKTDRQTVLRRPSHPFTIREALSHMTGLPFRSEVEVPTLDALPLATAVRSHAMTSLQWEPGTAYQYSNAGINTAARVLEVVAGMPYEEFMQKRLFDPLDMKDTTFWPNEEQVRRLAKTYRPNQAGDDLEEAPLGQLLSPLSDRSRRYPMPAGGLFSTAQDTARFCQMLLNGGEFGGRRILSEAAVAELGRRQTPESLKQSYGLGFSASGDTFGHGGAHATHMEVRRREGLVLVWMVQHAGFPLDGKQAQGEFRKAALAKFAGMKSDQRP